jgi:hypothetical protein
MNRTLTGGRLVCFFLLVVAGCSPTKVTTTAVYRGALPAPDVIVVYNFAVSPDEAALAPASTLAQMKKAAAAEKQLMMERSVADALANHLVDELTAKGLLAMRASVIGPPSDGNTLEIRGKFVSINNQQESVGLSGTNVVADVQVYETIPAGRQLVTAFRTDAKSSFKNNVDDDAKRTAQQLAQQINQMYNERGWFWGALMP